MGRKLTEEMVEDLRNDYGVLSTKEITEKYNCSYSTIERFCKSHGFKSKRSNGRSNTKKYPYPYEHVDEFLTDWEDNILSIEELEQKYFAPMASLYSIAKLYGKTRGCRPGGFKLTQEQENDVIDDYQEGVLTNKEICQKYNICQSTLSQILKRNNIVSEGATKRNRLYYFNENCLDTIDTEEKAYFLGFVYADGSHNEERHALVISIKKDDEALLQKFYQIFDSNKRVSYIYNKQYNRHYAQFCLQSVYLSTQLLNLGIMGNKTFKITFPPFIPEHLVRHFIRGYFDGDGCISLSKRGWKSTSVQMLGNEQFLCVVRDIINNQTGKLMGMYQKTKNDVYEIRSSGIFNVYAILNYLYKNATIYLPRKYNRYIDFITKYERECLQNESNGTN